MELYEFSDNKKKLLVYELEGVKESIRKYKEEHLRRRFYDLETVNKDLIDCLLNGGIIDEWRLKCKNKDLCANLITGSSETEYQKVVRDSLLRKYYNGECLGFNITQVYKTNDELDKFSPYALLPLDNYEQIFCRDEDREWFRYPNLLVISKDLVGLHFLEQGNYKDIALDDIISKEIPFYLFDLTLKNKYDCSKDVLDLLVMKDVRENIGYSSKVLSLYRSRVLK